MSSDYHSRMTSIGTKRAIRPYWAKYHRGKNKALSCPFHSICLELAWDDKRRLYAHGCPYCREQEGFPRAFFGSIHGYKSFEYFAREKPNNWMVEKDKLFQQKKKEILKQT